MAETKNEGFSAEERAAMKARAKELKNQNDEAASLADVIAAIKEMPPVDRVLAQRIHEIVLEAAPELKPRTYYGMPAYAKDGKVLCFFTPSQKFKTRYSSFGFEQPANLDDGTMWPTAFAVTKLGAAEEKKIADLVKKAVR